MEAGRFLDIESSGQRSAYVLYETFTEKMTVSIPSIKEWKPYMERYGFQPIDRIVGYCLREIDEDHDTLGLRSVWSRGRPIYKSQGTLRHQVYPLHAWLP